MIRRPWRLADSTLVAALAVQVIFFSGYCKGSDALSPLRPMARQILQWERHNHLPEVWYFDPRPEAATGKAGAGGYSRRSVPVDLSIYLNQNVLTAWDAGSIEVAQLPFRSIAVTLQRPDEAAPAVPNDWQELFSTNEPGIGAKAARVWRAYLLPGRGPPL
jgi:hypothetical protein